MKQYLILLKEVAMKTNETSRYYITIGVGKFCVNKIENGNNIRLSRGI